MRLFACLILAGLLLCSTAWAAVLEDQPDMNLPIVVLLGDSIRLSYAPVVTKELARKAIIVSPPFNGGTSSNLLKNLDNWAIRVRPAVVHFNCGIHDIVKSKTTGKFQVSPADYEANLRKIVERLRSETKAKVIFAVTTPLIDERAAKSRAEKDYELLDAAARQYNEIALRVMKELDVPIDDLRAALGSPERQAQLIGNDGVHFTTAGAEHLGIAVASSVQQHLPAASPSKSK